MKKEEQKYRKANKMVQKALKKAREDWMDTQCKEIDACLNKTNRKEESQLVEDTTSEMRLYSQLSRKCLTEEQEILSRWTEYYSELYTCESCGDNTVLDYSQHPEEDLQPILREEIEIAIAALKR